ncbi:hypothetical protein [Chondromyces apiculatus]|uniref:Uncharacterized protein n=1 Tax=Chondromyces apiculatus DSM 436 TaxID=1192034 RepID=A0A017T4L6_9BACT|nr:hypothetical protein [Chondromyces apiculatus]EYF04164.1 Hypothetical protein CAP_4847 [Chondromyces apiculatus DSM 436]
MDPLTPVAGLSVEQYAEICAEVADAPHDPGRVAQALAPRGIARADWETARSGWTTRLQDLSLGGAVVLRFQQAYQAALTNRRGPAPLLSFEDYAAVCGEAMASGLTVTLLRAGIETLRWSQIAFHWNTRIAREPTRFAPFMAMVEQEAARLASGGVPRPAPKPVSALEAPPPEPAHAAPLPAAPLPEPVGVAPLHPASPPPDPARGAPFQPVHPASPLPDPAHAAPLHPASPAHPVAPMTPAAGAYASPPPGAVPPPAPGQPQGGKRLEQQAGQAVASVGSALVSGFKELGSALDAFTKPAPRVGAGVLVTWSDGNRYPGTVVQLAPGQVLVSMSDGRQHWVPDTAVKSG